MLWPKLAFLTLFTLLFGASSWAEPGFQPSNSPSLPEAIRRASANVLQIWTPVAFTWRSSGNYAKIQHNLETMPGENFRQSIHFQMNREELQYCQEHRLERCRFTAAVTQGTAFVLSDGTLIGARHNFSQIRTGLQAKFAETAADWAARAKDPFRKRQVDAEIAAFIANPLADTLFFITDAHGKMVFNSAHQSYRFLRFGELTQFRGTVDLANAKAGLAGEDMNNEATSFSGADWIDRDSVRIQLSVRLPSLTPAREGCTPESPAYIVGFPGRATTTRASLGGRDSLYNELSVSTGKILSLQQVADRAAHWAEADAYFAAFNNRPTLVTDADGIDGISGGPILNARGEVCGMFKAFFPSDDRPMFNEGRSVLEMFSFGVPLEYLTGI